MMRMAVSDEELAQAAAGGDRAAFAALLERVYDRVFGLAFRLTGRRAEAEDIAQEVCATLPLKLRGWRGEGRLTTWLYRIVVNAVRDAHRRRVTRDKAALGWGDAELARRAEAAETGERLAWLHLAMDRLTPPELRETLVLVLDGLSHAEVAEVQGLSEGTVSWRVSQAKRKLRAMMEAEA